MTCSNKRARVAGERQILTPFFDRGHSVSGRARPRRTRQGDDWVEVVDSISLNVSTSMSVRPKKLTRQWVPQGVLRRQIRGLLRWVHAADSMVEVESDAHVPVRYSGDALTLPGDVSWVAVDLTNTDDTETDQGSYFVRFASDRSLLEDIVDADCTEMLLHRIGVEHIRLLKGRQLGTGGAKPEQGAMERVPEEEVGGPLMGVVA